MLDRLDYFGDRFATFHNAYLAAKNFYGRATNRRYGTTQLIHLKCKALFNRKAAQAQGVSSNTVNNYVQVFSEHELNYGQLEELLEVNCVDFFPRQTIKNTERYEQQAVYFPIFTKSM